jgi:hypothetical protein
MKLLQGTMFKQWGANDTAITDTNYAVAGLTSSTEYSFT